MPTDREYRLPDCPVYFWIGKTCPEQLNAGDVIPLAIRWSTPDDWLARLSQRFAVLLRAVGISWRGRWGQWRMETLETKAEVIQEGEEEMELRTVVAGVLRRGRRGTFGDAEGLFDAD